MINMVTQSAEQMHWMIAEPLALWVIQHGIHLWF